VLRAKDCVVGVMDTWACDFSADPEHRRVAQLQLTLNVGLTAVDFVCRDNVDGKKVASTFSKLS